VESKASGQRLVSATLKRQILGQTLLISLTLVEMPQELRGRACLSCRSICEIAKAVFEWFDASVSLGLKRPRKPKKEAKTIFNGSDTNKQGP